MNCNIRRYASRVTVAVAITFGLVAAGCGPIDDDTNNQKSVDQFTGTWEYDSGTVDVTCDGETFNSELSGNTTFSESTNADLLASGEDCNWDFDVSGDTAEVVPGQECEIENEDGTTTTVKPTQWSFEVDGASMTESRSAIATVEDASGHEVDCDYEASGSLTKVGE